MINYKLFPDIMLEDGKVYSNFNSEVSFIDAKDNIPFIRAYEHIGCKKNIFLVGGASIGKSTSLKVFRQKAHITKRMVYLECRGINEIDIRKLISDIADENIELVVFDALDELPAYVHRSFFSMLEVFLDDEIVRNSLQIIISSRFMPDHEEYDRSDLFADFQIIRLLSFSDKQINLLINKPINPQSGYFSLLKNTMLLSMHLELEKNGLLEENIYQINTEAEFIEQYFLKMYVQKRGEKIQYGDFVDIGRRIHKQRSGFLDCQKFLQTIPLPLQRIVSYKPNDSKPPLYAIDSEQMKYINYFHAAYIKYILLSLIDGERSMNGFSLAYEMTVGSWIERLFDIDSEYIKAEAYYFAGQLIDNEPENIKNNVLSVLDKAFLKTHNNYSNLLSLVCGLRHGILADEQFFRLFSEGTIKLSAENRLYNVYGLRHFIVSNYIDVIGDRTFFSCCELKKITIGSQVCHIGVAAFYRCRLLEKVEIADGVEFVGNSAFWECSELPQIELPDTIVGIGKCAFFGCKDLKSIYIPRRVSKIDLWAFSGCTSLERIEVSSENECFYQRDNCVVDRNGTIVFGCRTSKIPDDPHIVRIETGAFWGQKYFTRLHLPSNITEIGNYAFTETGLEEITVDENNQIYCASGNCLIHRKTHKMILGCKTSMIPNGLVETIGAEAFRGCMELEMLHIPASVKCIEEDVFRECGALKSIRVDDDNQYFFEIGNCLIKKDGTGELILGCSDSEIPEDKRVKSIGRGAFWNCFSKKQVHIPSNIEKIGAFAFSNCRNIRTISASTESKVFFSTNNCLIEKNTKTLVLGCSRSKPLNDGSIVKIGISAFDGCENINSISVPDSVVKIDDFAFRNCAGLRSVKLSDNTEHIGESAFRGCINLVKIEIPVSVKYIGDAAFMDCNHLYQIVYQGSEEEWSAIQIGEDAIPDTAVIFKKK